MHEVCKRRTEDQGNDERGGKRNRGGRGGKIKPAEVLEKHVPSKEELEADIKAGLPVKDMARKYGYKSASSVSVLLKKYGLTKKGEQEKSMQTEKAELMEFIEKRTDEVKALYTNGPFSLKKLAEEYSADQKLLHEVLTAKGLLKK